MSIFRHSTFNLACLVIALSAISACSKSNESNSAEATSANAGAIIKIDGSSTVYPITEAVAEEYQIATKVKVTVGISGTGGGFKKLCRGETDIQNASRPILEKEMGACKEAGIEYIELPIAYDALSVVVNKNNDFVTSITVEELKKMWEPAAQESIKTWNQVNPNWPDTPLRLFGAGSDSGTFDYFTEAIVGKAKSSRGDYTASEDDNVLVQGVQSDKGGLAYFGFAYYKENAERLKAVPIVAAAGKPAVAPSEASVKDGSYQPLSRPLFIYVNANSAKARPEVKAFVDAYFRDAKALVSEVSFIALPDNEYTAVEAHWQAMKVGTGFGGKPEVGIKIEELLARVK
ncbi:MAG: PstS family phosphate ABC transporter substrate-binding protein [Methylophilaceae bacterium]